MRLKDKVAIITGGGSLNEEHHRARAGEMAAELRSFLHSEKQPICHELWEMAWKRAVQLLSLLSIDDPALAAEVEKREKVKGV